MHKESDDDSTTDDSDHDLYLKSPTRSPLKDQSARNGEFLHQPHADQSRFSPAPDTDRIWKTRQPRQEEKVSTPSAEPITGQNSVSDIGYGPREGQGGTAADTRPVFHDTAIENSALPRSKAKLGKIGGKPKNDRDQEPNLDTHRIAKIPTSKQSVSSHRSIENDVTKSESPNKDIGSPRTGRAATQLELSSSPRESSQDRANRKREQLKRELESKSQAGTKKKRRF